jgi:hypothetical protein
MCMKQQRQEASMLDKHHSLQQPNLVSICPLVPFNFSTGPWNLSWSNIGFNIIGFNINFAARRKVTLDADIFLFFIFCYLRLVSPFLIILKELLRHENISHHLPRLCFPCCVMGGGGGVSHCNRPVGLTPD